MQKQGIVQQEGNVDSLKELGLKIFIRVLQNLTSLTIKERDRIVLTLGIPRTVPDLLRLAYSRA